MLKVLYVTNNTGFCRFYRCQSPAQYLSMSGLCKIQFIDPVDQSILNKGCMWADVVVFQHGVASKYVEILVNLINKNRLPQLVVCEYDDDIKNVTPINVGAYRYWGKEEIYIKGTNTPIFKDKVDGFYLKKNLERRRVLDVANRCCDLITVTTDQIADAFRPYNKNIEVLPNYINPLIMPEKSGKKRTDKVRILWQGGDSHFADLMLVMPALKKIKDLWKDKVEFVFWGISFRSVGKDIDATFIPWSCPELFFPRFSEEHFDIGIIPIEDTKFNHSKSNIKWLEYSYYNIPSVIQNNLPYKQHIKHGETGLLFNNNQQMFDNINYLIKNPLARSSIAGNARRKVMSNYNLETKFKLWHDVYEKHLKNKIKKYNT